MKITKIGSLEFVDLDLMDMQKLGLMDLVACGSHCDRYCEDDGVWDLSCLKCALRYETAEKVASRIATRLREQGLEIPPRKEQHV
jgi:hypothetical protein